jgi:cytoskeletal protein CcmA (bactofilin family)
MFKGDWKLFKILKKRNLNNPKHFTRRLEDKMGGIETTIAKGNLFNGIITGKDSVRIAGICEGEIMIDGLIWVESTGRIRGKVKAGGVIVEGEIDGDINSSGKVEIRAEGKVKGNIKCAKIACAEGCFFEGEIKMPVEKGNQKIFEEKRRKSFLTSFVDFLQA